MRQKANTTADGGSVQRKPIGKSEYGALASADCIALEQPLKDQYSEEFTYVVGDADG